MKKVMAGINVHSNNVGIGVMDTDGKRLANRKVPCELNQVVSCLAQFRKRLEQVAVESTYNWYWLVDGLRALAYPVVLANPAGSYENRYENRGQIYTKIGIRKSAKIVKSGSDLYFVTM